MTEEEIKQKFKEIYPDFMRGDEPLSPYFDIWEYGIEIATKELQEELNYAETHCLFHSDCPTQKENGTLSKRILELQADKGRLIDELTDKSGSIYQLTEQLAEQDKQIKELETS